MDTKITSQNPTANTSSNFIAKVIKIIAIVIYVCGFFAGIMVGLQVESFLITLLYWVAAALSGTMMLGFSEVIRLLHEINSKIK